jgi:hypothetical protein
MRIPQPMNGGIFQTMSELEAGHLALNSSRFTSRFDRAPVFRRSPKIPPSEYDEILQGHYRLNSAQFHQGNRQGDARGSGDDEHESLSRKTARLLEDDVNIEPPSSMDDFS